MAAPKLKLEKDEENLKNKIYLNNINRSNLLKKLISTQLVASNSTQEDADDVNW